MSSGNLPSTDVFNYLLYFLPIYDDFSSLIANPTSLTG
ncbi:hypothetical protein ECDEC10B_2047 [Escherichia coli DEC10B]|nr:hypothetical protein ECDEC10B_2047 [Escherichia coli DEC10B]